MRFVMGNVFISWDGIDGGACMHDARQVGRAANSWEEGGSGLRLSDFTYVEKVTFPPNGCNTSPHITPAHKLAHTFKFKTYAPRVFHRLREYYDLDAPSYMESVCGERDPSLMISYLVLHLPAVVCYAQNTEVVHLIRITQP